MAWILFTFAGLVFWAGGRAINEFAKTERILAEVESIGLAAVCAGLGAVAKTAGDHFAEAEEDGTPTPEDEPL